MIYKLMVINKETYPCQEANQVQPHKIFMKHNNYDMRFTLQTYHKELFLVYDLVPICVKHIECYAKARLGFWKIPKEKTS